MFNQKGIFIDLKARSLIIAKIKLNYFDKIINISMGLVEGFLIASV